MKSQRTALYMMLITGLVMMTISARFVPSWAAWLLFGCTWLPHLSAQVKLAAWRPWWLDSCDEIDARPVWIFALIFDAGATAAAISGGWGLALGVRLLGMLAQLAQLGKYERESLPLPNDHHRANRQDQGLPDRSSP